VMSNYFFALIILLLMLPEDETLETIDRGIFLYALLATALPEISSNLRLQLGQSSRMLDLYKYKKRVSDMISERLEKSSREVKDRELELLTYYFTGRLEQFENKLVLFSQRDFTKEEKTDLTALIKEVHDGVEQEKGEEKGKGETVAHLLVNHSLVLPKLLEFFQNDMRTIQGSPVVQLISGLQPLLTLTESRALVQSGITTPGAFVRRCWFSFRRTSLAQKTGLDQERIELIYRTTRGIIRGRRRSRAKWAFAVVVLILVITNLGALYGGRLHIIVSQTTADNAIEVDLGELLPKLDQGAQE